MVFSIASELTKVDAENIDTVRSRIQLVHAAQRRIGMEPRDDSVLTFRYGAGGLEEEDVPSAIASELYIVDRLYKHTEYGNLLEEVLRGLAHHIKHKYRLPWTDTWEIVRFYGPTMCKLYCSKIARNE